MGVRMKKRLKNLSIQQRISYSFTLFFTVLVICIIFVLRGIYSSQMYEKLMQGRSYEDNLIVQQMSRPGFQYRKLLQQYYSKPE